MNSGSSLTLKVLGEPSIGSHGVQTVRRFPLASTWNHTMPTVSWPPLVLTITTSFTEQSSVGLRTASCDAKTSKESDAPNPKNSLTCCAKTNEAGLGDTRAKLCFVWSSLRAVDWRRTTSSNKLFSKAWLWFVWAFAKRLICLCFLSWQKQLKSLGWLSTCW